LVIFSIYLESAILSLLFGVLFAYSFYLPTNFFTKKLGNKLIQIGIVLLAFSIPIYEAYELTKSFIPAISMFVVMVFLLGLIFGKFLNLRRNQIILISSGTAICGASAIAAIAPILKASPKTLLTSISLVFILNAIALVIFPFLGHYLGFSQNFFGSWIALAVHDTASVIGTALVFGDESVISATTIKLSRTLWLVPLMVILSFIYNKKADFKLPIFVLAFIAVLFLNNYLSSNMDILPFIALLKSIGYLSNCFLYTGLFFIGTSIDKESIFLLDNNIVFHALLLWIIAILLSYILVSYVI